MGETKNYNSLDRIVHPWDKQYTLNLRKKALKKFKEQLIGIS